MVIGFMVVFGFVFALSNHFSCYFYLLVYKKYNPEHKITVEMKEEVQIVHNDDIKNLTEAQLKEFAKRSTE